LKRYKKYIMPYKSAFICGPILMLTEVAGEIALPKMMSLIINNGVANKDMGYIIWMGIAMVLTALVMAGGGIGAAYFAAKAFFKEMKEFDYKGMNRYVKDWGEGGQLVSAFYMVPSGKKYFAKCASKMSYRIISTKKKGNKADVKVKFRYVNCEDFTFNFCMNAFYYMADGKLDNLSSMSEKQVIKLVNGIIDKSQKDTKFNRFKTKTVTIRFVKAKNCWKVQKVSDKLADVMMANFASNLQNLATFSISSACGEKSAYVIPETSEYGTVQKKVLVKVLKNIYGRKPELSA